MCANFLKQIDHVWQQNNKFLDCIYFPVQGCDVLKCAPKKVDCKMQCNENGKESDGCMRCWNEFKLNCSECIPKGKITDVLSKIASF